MRLVGPPMPKPPWPLNTSCRCRAAREADRGCARQGHDEVGVGVQRYTALADGGVLGRVAGALDDRVRATSLDPRDLLLR